MGDGPWVTESGMTERLRLSPLSQKVLRVSMDLCDWQAQQSVVSTNLISKQPPRSFPALFLLSMKDILNKFFFSWSLN